MRSQEQAKATMDMSEEPFCMEIYRKKCTWTCQKSHFVWKFTGKKAQAQVTGAILWLPGTTFWMEVEAHVTRAILYGNLQEKCRTRMLRSAFCGNLQEKMHMDMSQGQFCVEIYRKNAAHPFPGPHFVWKFTGKNAHGHCTRAILCGNLQEKCGAPPSPPGPTRAPFYSYRKNPFSVATLFGEKCDVPY